MHRKDQFSPRDYEAWLNCFPHKSPNISFVEASFPSALERTRMVLGLCLTLPYICQDRDKALCLGPFASPKVSKSTWTPFHHQWAGEGRLFPGLSSITTPIEHYALPVSKGQTAFPMGTRCLHHSYCAHPCLPEISTKRKRYCKEQPIQAVPLPLLL